MRLQEEKFHAKEEWYVQRRERLNASLRGANDKYRRVSARLAELRALADDVGRHELTEGESAAFGMAVEARSYEAKIDESRARLEESERRCQAMEERYENAVRSFTQLKEDARTQGARLEQRDKIVLDQRGRIEELKARVEALSGTASYQIGSALVRASRSSGEALRLPGRLWRIYRSRRTGEPPAPTRSEERNAGATARRGIQFDRDFEAFLADVQQRQPTHFVVMFGGTTYIQEIRANRPIRLTRSLVDQDVPVLFNFHRWRDSDHIPPYDGNDPLVFQSPTDLTPQLVARLLHADLGEARKLFVVSYPHPAVLPLVPQLNVNGWATLYDCRDDWAEFAKVGAARWYRESIERYVVNHCDMTCCVSSVLRDKMDSYADGKPVRLSRNAFDPAFLTPGYRHAPGERVTIGYFGHLTPSWFDWELVRWIARQRADWCVQIAGHGSPDAGDLDLPGNVELLGPRKHAELCELGASWHAAIIPFKVGPLADAVDPIKIYEYFSLGLPVVASRMPQVADYPYTRTVETREEFVVALDQAVATRCDPQVLSDFLGRNTWRARACQMIEWADEIIASPSCEKLFHMIRA
jgi:glycosyltransferase involved in cell wall biosynthesis